MESNPLLHELSLDFFISAIVVSLLTGGIQDPSVRFAVREIFLRLPLTLVLFWLFAHYVVKKPSSFFLIRKPTKEILKWIAIGFVLPLSVITIYLIFGKIELLGHAEPLSPSVIIYLVVATISIALLGGIIEEILFRGYMFRILEDKWNTTIAILGHAMLFGSIHLLMIDRIDLVNVILVVIPISLIGVMFGLIVHVTRNIWNTVVIPGIWNLFLAGRIIRVSAFEDHQFNAIYQLQITSDNILLTGGSFGVESAVPAIAVYLTAILVLLLYTARKCCIHFKKHGILTGFTGFTGC
ncbi:MAG: type II CAAX endopeptidase family protein [Euryarchaeota archaeon]|nr:type II CAAX endopeptidase family protein [Euryarchaeota archaeon]